MADYREARELTSVEAAAFRPLNRAPHTCHPERRRGGGTRRSREISVFPVQHRVCVQVPFNPARARRRRSDEPLQWREDKSDSEVPEDG